MTTRPLPAHNVAKAKADGIPNFNPQGLLVQAANRRFSHRFVIEQFEPFPRPGTSNVHGWRSG